MGMYRCEDCERNRDSKNDGYNECDDDYICDSCLENRQDEHETEQAIHEDVAEGRREDARLEL